MQEKQAGNLYVVATPIGNLKDITLRAIEVLKSVDRIAVEDTRHAVKLLNHFSIKKPILSLHAFNENQKMKVVLAHLGKGESIALISDAGTPLISDPGFLLISEARKENINVFSIPGPCAAIAALSCSGLPTAKFIFEGFLPAKEKERNHYLQSLVNETRTLIFYVPPHRLLAVLKSFFDVFGAEREIVIAKELTKIHERVLSGTISNLFEFYKKQPKIQGEFVVLIKGNTEAKTKNEIEFEKVLDVLLNELSLKQAVALASKITGIPKNTLYKLALQKNRA